MKKKVKTKYKYLKFNSNILKFEIHNKDQYLRFVTLVSFSGTNVTGSHIPKCRNYSFAETNEYSTRFVEWFAKQIRST